MPLQFEDLTQLNDFIYFCAQLSIEIANLENKCLVKNKQKQQSGKDEKWKLNLKRRIDELRSD